MNSKEVRNNCEWKCWGTSICKFFYIKKTPFCMLELRFVLSDFTWQALAYLLNEQGHQFWRRFKFKRLASIAMFSENFTFILLNSLHLKENDAILSEYVWQFLKLMILLFLCQTNASTLNPSLIFSKKYLQTVIY